MSALNEEGGKKEWSLKSSAHDFLLGEEASWQKLFDESFMNVFYS